MGKEMFYHIIIKSKFDKKGSYGECKIDLTKDQLLSRYVEPYELANPIIINGTTINPNDIEHLTITCSEHVIESYTAAIRAERLNSREMLTEGPGYTYTAIVRANNVTDEFIVGPPGFKKITRSKADARKKYFADNKKIFIVHGHDETAKEKTARFVEKLGLEAIILHEQASSGRTIIEKIEKHTDVGFAIILYTSDDLGNTKTKAAELNIRARQNVVFEHGFLIAKLGRERVAALVDGYVELPNDISGVVYIKFDEADAWHLHLAKEMKQSGYHIDINVLIS